jgi:glutamate-5-semialdehyde dehydrogenase
MTAMNLTEQITQLAKQAKTASRELAKLTRAEKNSCLLGMADALEKKAGAIKKTK